MQLNSGPIQQYWPVAYSTEFQVDENSDKIIMFAPFDYLFALLILLGDLIKKLAITCRHDKMCLEYL